MQMPTHDCSPSSHPCGITRISAYYSRVQQVLCVEPLQRLAPIDEAREQKYHYNGEYAGRENQYRATAEKPDYCGAETHYYDATTTLPGENTETRREKLKGGAQEGHRHRSRRK